jgi:hypothetical protein
MDAQKKVPSVPTCNCGAVKVSRPDSTLQAQQSVRKLPGAIQTQFRLQTGELKQVSFLASQDSLETIVLSPEDSPPRH